MSKLSSICAWTGSSSVVICRLYPSVGEFSCSHRSCWVLLNSEWVWGSDSLNFGRIAFSFCLRMRGLSSSTSLILLCFRLRLRLTGLSARSLSWEDLFFLFELPVVFFTNLRLVRLAILSVSMSAWLCCRNSFRLKLFCVRREVSCLASTISFSALLAC
jgi:hypothetical protein